MKSTLRILSILALSTSLVGVVACNKNGANKNSASQFKTETEKVSYILGYSTGKSLSDQSVDVSSDLFMRGMKDGLSKKDDAAAMTEEEMRDTMQAFRMNLLEKHRKESEEKSATNLAAGEKFMTENKAKPGVVTLPSGLQYKVITEGTGAKAMANDSVTVEYKGTSLDGKEFDSTEKQGKPATFQVGSTIPGMSEALQLMPAGSNWQLFIPAALAYGAQGAGGTIGPNETLIFDVKVVSIEKAQLPTKDKASANNVKKKK